MSKKFEQVSTSQRYEVLRRDGFACRYCGAKAPDVRLHVDHVVPRAHGGTNDSWNLTAACQACIAGKSDGVPDEETIISVREDEAAYQKSRWLPVAACMHCSKPVQLDPDGDLSWPQCEACNREVCLAYEAGYSKGISSSSRPRLEVVS